MGSRAISICRVCGRHKTPDEVWPTAGKNSTALCRLCWPKVCVFRELFRNLCHFRMLFETHGIDVIGPGPLGDSYSLWDLEYLVAEVVPLLPERQSQAILFFLVENHREMDTALMMGLTPTNPIGKYATEGVAKIVEWMESGRLARFKVNVGAA